MEECWVRQCSDSSASVSVAVDELAIVLCITDLDEVVIALHRDTGAVLWTQPHDHTVWSFCSEADDGLLVRVNVSTSASAARGSVQYMDPTSGAVVAQGVLPASRWPRHPFHGLTEQPCALPCEDTCTADAWAALQPHVANADAWDHARFAHDLLCVGAHVLRMIRNADGVLPAYSGVALVLELPPVAVYSTPVPLCNGTAVAFMNRERTTFYVLRIDGVLTQVQCADNPEDSCWFPFWCFDSRQVYLSTYTGRVHCFTLPSH